MNRFDLHLLTGNPGAGKTTAAIKLSKAFGVPVLDPDLMRRELGFTEYDPSHTPTIMQEIFRRKIDALYRGEPVIMATPYVRRTSREQSYRLIHDLSIELGDNLMAVLIACECPEEISKERIKNRVGTDGLHRATNDPRKWDVINAQKVNIASDEMTSNPHFSFLRYETDSDRISRLIVGTGMDEAVSEIEHLLIK